MDVPNRLLLLWAHVDRPPHSGLVLLCDFPAEQSIDLVDIKRGELGDLFGELVAVNAQSKSSGQHQDKQDHDQKPKCTAAIMARAVKWTAADAAETSKQDNKQKDKQDRSSAHYFCSWVGVSQSTI